MIYGYYQVQKEDIIWFEINTKGKGFEIVKESISNNGNTQYSIKFKDSEDMDDFNNTIRESSNVRIC